MKQYLILLISLFSFGHELNAESEKIIRKNIPIEPGKKIEFANFSRLKIDFVKWDKNEIGFKLKAIVDCSDDEYEKEFADSMDVISKSSDDKQEICLVKKKKEAKKISFLGLFSFRFLYHFGYSIVGEIYLPGSFPGNINISYSELSFEGMTDAPSIAGVSNDLVFTNCSGIPKIKNSYGKINLENTRGDLQISSRSDEIEILGHRGSLDIDAEYSKIIISDVNGIVSMNNRSADIEVTNCVLKSINSPYSKIVLRNIAKLSKGELSLNGNSLTCSLDNVMTDLKIVTDYSKIDFNNLQGALILSGYSNSLKGKKIEGNISINTKYTPIEISSVSSKETQIQNSNDDISLQYTVEPSVIDIKSIYGDVKVKLPRTYKGEITATASYGKIKSDFNTKVTNQNDHTITHHQQGETTPGTITINTQNCDVYLLNKKSSFFLNPVLLH